ncbi:hypothetical protein PSAC2689_20503 [Paraburkholderia sacchari]
MRILDDAGRCAGAGGALAGEHSGPDRCCCIPGGSHGVLRQAYTMRTAPPDHPSDDLL